MKALKVMVMVIPSLSRYLQAEQATLGYSTLNEEADETNSDARVTEVQAKAYREFFGESSILFRRSRRRHR